MTSELDEKLHKLLPSLRNAITVIIGMHPETMPIFEMVDEIWQIRAGISLLSDDEVINDDDFDDDFDDTNLPRPIAVSKDDAEIFAKVHEIFCSYPIVVEGLNKDNKGDVRSWAIAVPSIDYTWGIADSPKQLLEAVKASADHYVNHKKLELLQDPIVHDAYVLQAQHNEAVEEHNKGIIGNNGMPYELHFKVDIEFHDDLRWLIGTSVTDGGRWASTPDELLKAVKDNIEYLETHEDEIKQLLGG